jgi:hypothetical protein
MLIHSAQCRNRSGPPHRPRQHCRRHPLLRPRCRPHDRTPRPRNGHMSHSPIKNQSGQPTCSPRWSLIACCRAPQWGRSGPRHPLNSRHPAIPDCGSATPRHGLRGSDHASRRHPAPSPVPRSAPITSHRRLAIEPPRRVRRPGNSRAVHPRLTGASALARRNRLISREANIRQGGCAQSVFCSAHEPAAHDHPMR